MEKNPVKTGLDFEVIGKKPPYLIKPTNHRQTPSSWNEAGEETPVMKDLSDEFTPSTKLQLLCQANPEKRWESLNETRHCILCERTITGQEIRVKRNRRGEISLHCPTKGCRSTPEEWIHPENPLISEAAWQDWVRLLDSLCDDDLDRRKPFRRFKPSDSTFTVIPFSDTTVS